MKVLSFYFRGERYLVNEQGHMKANGLKEFSDTWIFLGGTKHHWSNHITVSRNDAFENPALLEKCLGFDKDHGTIRRWGGQYCGMLPRITGVSVITI